MSNNYKPMQPKDLIHQGVTLMVEIIKSTRELKIHKYHWVAAEARLLFEIYIYGRETIDPDIFNVYVDSADIITDDAIEILKANLISYLEQIHYRHTDMSNQIERAAINLGHKKLLSTARR